MCILYGSRSGGTGTRGERSKHHRRHRRQRNRPFGGGGGRRQAGADGSGDGHQTGVGDRRTGQCVVRATEARDVQAGGNGKRLPAAGDNRRPPAGGPARPRGREVGGRATDRDGDCVGGGGNAAELRERGIGAGAGAADDRQHAAQRAQLHPACDARLRGGADRHRHFTGDLVDRTKRHVFVDRRRT